MHAVPSQAALAHAIPVLATYLDTLWSNLHARDAMRALAYSASGGLAGLFLRGLYRRFGLTVSNRDSLGSTFPLLVVATVLIIFIVKSSLSLSLGLVGALSIVRFRAAIKEPEELVFLFFSIAVGLALGAQHPELAVAGLLCFTAFMLIRHYTSRRGGHEALLLTLSGPTEALFNGDARKMTAVLREAIGDFVVQRLDVEGGQVQFRAVVTPASQEQLLDMVSALRERVPDCHISYVNLANLL